jgi:NAD(P)-dependent dehydrogenase (short-subunit alcohol dehydrogenase family)
MATITINSYMRDKICMVTGATSGIGRVTAEALALEGAHVIVVGRDREKSRAAVDAIRESAGNPEVEFMVADLSSVEDVYRLARKFRDKYRRLDVLVNNAGAMFTKRQVSREGNEMTLALNFLGPFLLTNLLLAELKAAAPSRVINVSSGAHRMGRIKLRDLQAHRGYSGWRAYGQSKLALLHFTYELARRLRGTGVTVNAVHPGFVATNFGKTGGFTGAVLDLLKTAARPPEQGAETVIHLAVSPELAEVTGKYFVDRKMVRSSRASYDRAMAQKLWTAAEELTGLPLSSGPRPANRVLDMPYRRLGSMDGMAEGRSLTGDRSL